MKLKLILITLLLPLVGLAQTRQTGGIGFTPQWNFKISGSDTTWQFGNTLMSPQQFPYLITKWQADQRYAAIGSGGGAGTTTFPITFNNGGAGVASGTTFNGSVARTISYNTIGALGATQTAVNSAGWNSNSYSATNIIPDFFMTTNNGTDWRYSNIANVQGALNLATAAYLNADAAATPNTVLKRDGGGSGFLASLNVANKLATDTINALTDTLRIRPAGGAVNIDKYVRWDPAHHQFTVGDWANLGYLPYGTGDFVARGSAYTGNIPKFRTQSAGQRGYFVGDRVNGTFLNPTALVANDEMVSFLGNGYPGLIGGVNAGVVHASEMRAVADENWSATQNGSRWDWYTIPNGTITQVLGLRLSGNNILTSFGGVHSQKGFALTDTYDAGLQPGWITKHSTVGLVTQGITGSVFDWSIYSNSGTMMLANPTGTNTIIAPKIQSSQVPSAGDDLVNKTALDAAVSGGGIVRAVSISSSLTLSLTAGTDYFFTGTTGVPVWELPTISSGNAGGTYQVTIKNRGSVNLSINVDGGGSLYTSAPVGFTTVTPGSSVRLISDGAAYWNVE